MNSKLFLLILISVMLSALAQLMFKLGMSRNHIQHILTRRISLETAWTVASNPEVIGGICLYVLSTTLWLLVLSKVNVSVAYPFAGLGFILIVIFGWLIFHEPVSISRITGTTFIALGIYLVSKS